MHQGDEQRPDDELLTLFRETGDKRYVGVLFDRYYEALVAAARSRLRGWGPAAGEAEQLAVEPFIQLLRERHTLAGYDAQRSSVPRFLRLLLHDAIADWHRRGKQQRALHSQHLREEAPRAGVLGDAEAQAYLAEFQELLRPAEKRCLREVILGQPRPPGARPLSKAHIDFLMHQIRVKLAKYYDVE